MKTPWIGLFALALFSGAGTGCDADDAPTGPTDAAEAEPAVQSFAACVEMADVDLTCASSEIAWVIFGDEVGCQSVTTPPRRALLTVGRDAEDAPLVEGLEFDEGFLTSPHREALQMTWSTPVPLASLAGAHEVTMDLNAWVLREGITFVGHDHPQAVLMVRDAPTDEISLAAEDERPTIVGEFSAEGGRFEFSDEGRNFEVEDPTARLEGCFRMTVRASDP